MTFSTEPARSLALTKAFPPVASAIVVMVLWSFDSSSLKSMWDFKMEVVDSLAPFSSSYMGSVLSPRASMG